MKFYWRSEIGIRNKSYFQHFRYNNAITELQQQKESLDIYNCIYFSLLISQQLTLLEINLNPFYFVP